MDSVIQQLKQTFLFGDMNKSLLLYEKIQNVTFNRDENKQIQSHDYFYLKTGLDIFLYNFPHALRAKQSVSS